MSKSLAFLILNMSSLFLYKNCFANITEIYPDSRITGGYIPKQHTLAKYIVSIRSRRESVQAFGYTHFCAGAIIKPDVILTAAHCVSRINAFDLKVVARTSMRLNKTLYTQQLNVLNIIIHPDYQERKLLNDIALLILVDNILLDKQLADKIPLPLKDIESGVNCTAIGWGKLYMNGPFANDLIYVNISLYKAQYCKRYFKNHHINGKQICAADVHDQEKDACIGDSGGPLICDDVVAGIISYGYGCASHYAGVYTNVFSFKDWINKNCTGQINKILILFLVNFLLIFHV